MKISILDITKKSYVSFFKNLPYIFRISWAWILLLIIIIITPTIIDKSTNIYFALAIFITLKIYASAAIATAWHQKLLTNNYPKNWIYLNINKNIFLYLMKSFFLIFLCSLSFIIIGSINDLRATQNSVTLLNKPMTMVYLDYLVYSLVIVFPLIVFSRFCLILPATAIGDRTVSFHESYKTTKGYSIQIMCVILLTSLPLILWNEPNQSIHKYIFNYEKVTTLNFDPKKVRIGKIVKNTQPNLTQKLQSLMIVAEPLFLTYFISLLTALLNLSAISQIYLTLQKQNE